MSEIYSENNNSMLIDVLDRSQNNYTKKINLLKYDQNSKKVPAYYNRPGPGMYENNQNLSKLSKFESSPGVKMSKAGMSNGFLQGKVAQHRFTEYDKAKVCFGILEQKKDGMYENEKIIKKYRRQELLNPST
jgi:hypothetical protein